MWPRLPDRCNTILILWKVHRLRPPCLQPIGTSIWAGCWKCRSACCCMYYLVLLAPSPVIQHDMIHLGT